MSGHHDFTQNDFNLQNSGEIGIDPRTTSKHKQPNFTLGSTIEVEARKLQDDNQIEESIIEEEINHQTAGPPSPLLHSKNKGKAKLDLKMMKPPKPLMKGSNSPDNNN